MRPQCNPSICSQPQVGGHCLEQAVWAGVLAHLILVWCSTLVCLSCLPQISRRRTYAVWATTCLQRQAQHCACLAAGAQNTYCSQGCLSEMKVLV